MRTAAGLFKTEYRLLGLDLLIVTSHSFVEDVIVKRKNRSLGMLDSYPAANNLAAEAAVRYLDLYAKGVVSKLPPLSHASSSANEIKVLKTLCENVPFGSTITYGELADLGGFPRAARFVGSVMRKNVYPVIIPCHRVLHASGGVGMYSAGVDVKKKLLDFEREMSASLR